MQELKKTHPTFTENFTAAARLVICLQGVYHHLAGKWQWEMNADTVFCSDVMMCWPANAEGTRAIFYPDDVPEVKSALSATSPRSLSFRIITTYGEVKTLYGEDVFPAGETDYEQPPMPQWAVEAEQSAEAAKEAVRNALRLSTCDYAERLTKTGVWYTNLSTGETWFSDEMYRLLGLPPQSLNPHSNSLYAFLHSEDRKEVIDALEESYAKQFPLHLEFRVVQSGGAEKWMQQSTTFWFNKSGQVMMSGLLQDVTTQKETELLCEGLEATASFQKQLLLFAESSANIGYWHINVVTKKVTYSDNFLRLFGLRPQSASATASTLTNLVHPDDRELYEQVQIKIRREHAVPDFDFRIVRPDGKTRYIRQRGKVIVTGAEVLLAGTIQDVTVQRSLELKAAEVQQAAKVRAFVTEKIEAAAGVGSWVWNLKTEDIQWSDNFHDVVGVKAVTAKTTQALLLRAVHPDDQKRFSDELAMAMQEGKASDFPFRLIRRGEVRHLKASFRLATVEEERLFIGVLQDVTPEQQSLQSLTERVRLIETLADSIPDQVFVTDADNTVILWNRRCEEVHHRKREKVIGENFFDVLPLLKQDFVVARFDRVLAGEEIRLKDQPGRFTLRGVFDMAHIPLTDEAGAVNGILHILHEVTAEYELHQQLTNRLQFIERLLEVSADSIVALDRNMNYQYWNKKAEESFGLLGTIVIGKNILEVFPEVPQLLYKDFRRALRGETVHLLATDEQPQEHYLIPVHDQRNEVTTVLWVQHDRSGEFAIRRQSQKALDILKALNENYLELDLHYRVRFVNSQTLLYFQRTEEQVVGHVLWDVFPALVDTPLHLAMVHAMEERIVIRREFASPLHNISLLVSIAPTVDGLAVAFSDIGFIKEAERQVAEEHRRMKEAQSLGHIGSFEWVKGEAASHWSDALFHIHEMEPGEVETTLDVVHGFIHADDKKEVLALMETSSHKPGNHQIVHRIYTKNGNVRWVNHQWETIADERGEVQRIRGIVQDITGQKEASEEIIRLKETVAQKATDKYLTLFNSIDEGFVYGKIIVSEDGVAVDYHILDVNPAYEKMTGIKSEDVIGKTVREITPAIEDVWIEQVGRAALGGETLRFENFVAALNKWFETYLSPASNTGDGHFVAVFKDTTEKKKAEVALQESEKKYRLLFESIDEGYCLIQLIYGEAGRAIDWQYLEANPTFEKQVGFNPVGLRVSSFVPSLEDFWLRFYEKVAKQRKAARTENKVEGLNRWYQVYASPVADTSDLIAVIFDDITERKRREVQQVFLLQLNDRLLPISDAVSIQKIITQTVLEHLNANRCYYCEFDNDIATIRRDAFTEGLPSVVATYDMAEMPVLRTMLQATQPIIITDVSSTEAIDEGLKELCLAMNIYAYINVPVQKNGKVVGSFCITQSTPRQWTGDEVKLAKEIGELAWATVARANTEEQLRQSEAKNREWLEKELHSQTAMAQTIVDASIDQITIFDREERFVVWNKKAEEAGGLSRENVIGKTIAEVFPDIADEPEFLEAQQKALAGEPVYIPAKRGLYSTAYQQWFYVPLKNEEGEVYAVMNIIHDITDKVQAEEQLKRKNQQLLERNEEIAHFNFIASHDLREPLRKVGTFSNWLVEKEVQNLSDTGKQMLQKLTRSVERMELLIEDISTLTHLQKIPGDVETVELNMVLRKAVAVLQPMITAAEAVIDGNNLPTIAGYNEQLETLFVNLISNGIKFQKGGMIPVVEVNCKRRTNPIGLPRGDWYCLSFADNGIGFDVQYNDKIFREFQRLHGQSEYPGTGMGLAICRKVMENHGGYITAVSEPGKGARFDCWFPVV